MNVLVANAGSSSLKLRLVDDSDSVTSSANLPAPVPAADESALQDFVGEAGDFDAVGHRVVHGGRDFREPIVVDGEAVHRLEALADLAPLHNGPALAVLATLRRLCPDVPHVACFDTTFHSSLPRGAALYALPRAWIDRHGLRRFGFHGLSHAWAARRAEDLLGRPASELRLVTCHLGAGASLAAVAGGRSVDTTMGFTPNEGLVMATRSGSVDPGLLVWLLRHGDLTPEELEHALEHDSGLRGLSGTSGDMRAVIDAAEAGEPAAATALEVYVHRLRGCIAAMAAAMGGLDALVFTAGVGEHSPPIRADACAGLAFLGIELDDAKNDAATPDADISAEGARVAVLVIESREELEIARSVRALLGSD